MRKLYIITIGLVTLLLLGFLLFNQNMSVTTDVKSSSILKSAPKIELVGTDNNLYKLPEYEKKPAVMFFWASWCPGCNAEAPELVKLEAKYKDQIRIFGVNLTHMDTKEDAKEFINKYGITFPILWDEKGDAMAAYGVRGTPTSFYIDRHGMIQDMSVGFPGTEVVEEKINKLIEFSNVEQLEEEHIE
jgi:cytochrome c biogenesis protein CcmG/thiol:disulfide interchange protein DsbE